MRSKRILAVSTLAILIIAGVLVSHVLADNQADQKACCGTCRSVEKTAASACGSTCGGAAMATVAHAAHAGHAAHAAGASVQQCPVTQFMTRLSAVDLSEAQIEKMMVIWKGTEKKLLGVLTPVQMAKMQEPLPLQSVMAARVAAQVENQSQPQAAGCGSCSGTQAKGCPADCMKTCCAK